MLKKLMERPSHVKAESSQDSEEFTVSISVQLRFIGNSCCLVLNCVRACCLCCNMSVAIPGTAKASFVLVKAIT